MIDDKKIEKAANLHRFELIASRHGSTLGNPMQCFKEIIDAETDLIEDSFTTGAKWAINEFLKNLWHPASEEPKVCVVAPCIIELEGDYYNGRKFEVHDYHKGCGFSTSKGWLDNDKIIQWAYLSDILPKQKGGNHD